jgi:hypothetical protein
MRYLRFARSHWLMYFSVLVVFVAASACGTAAPDTPAPTVVSTPTPTSPPATLSAEIGQGAVGAASAPTPTPTPAGCARRTPIRASGSPPEVCPGNFYSRDQRSLFVGPG